MAAPFMDVSIFIFSTGEDRDKLSEQAYHALKALLFRSIIYIVGGMLFLLYQDSGEDCCECELAFALEHSRTDKGMLHLCYDVGDFNRYNG